MVSFKPSVSFAALTAVLACALPLAGASTVPAVQKRAAFPCLPPTTPTGILSPQEGATIIAGQSVEIQFCTSLYHSVSTSGVSIFLNPKAWPLSSPYAGGVIIAPGLTQNTGSGGYDWEGETPQFVEGDAFEGEMLLSVQELQSNGVYAFHSINVTVVQPSS